MFLFWIGPGILHAQTQITTWADLYNVRNNLDGNYVLMNNLDQDSPGYDTYASSSSNSDAGWEPIGTESTPFTGEFDGQDFSITGLTINRPGTSYIGLFGATNSAVIANIHLLELQIAGNSDVGGLIGNIDGGSVTNSSASGSVTASSDVGGLVGQNVSAPITKSFASVEVIASGSGSAVGGLVGRFQGFSSSVSESYATGDVEGGVSVGGLVGSVATFGSVNDSYATGEVSGLTNVGGLVGSITGLSGFGGIHRSYATGFINVIGSYAGGLIGSIEDVSVSNSYWNTDTSGRENAVGNGLSSGTTGRTDEEMRKQASFSGFDFSTVWQIEEDVWYPVLRNNKQDIPGETEIPVPTLEIPVNAATDVLLNPTFDWSVSNDVDSFELEISNSSDFSDFFLKITLITASEYNLSFKDLEADTLYYWRVRSVDNEETGEWSEVFAFTTVARPETSDQRLLVSNSEEYIFSGIDFVDEEYSIKIISLPDEGILRFDGNPVAENEEISMVDIENNLLTWTPPGGQYGYAFTSFDFSLIDENELESEESYTMTFDLAATTVKLTGGEGWRFVGNPSDGDSYDDLLGPLWTKGMPGSDSPGATFANVFNLDQAGYQWEEPSDLNNSTDAGQPFIVYVYGDDDNNGSDDGFPKTLASGDNWLPLDGSFSFDGLGYEETNNPDNTYLLANPHPVALDFCEVFDESSADIANNIDLWDPSANSGNGDYVNVSCSIGEVLIAPFQAFWVRTTGDNPEMNLVQETYQSEATDGYFKQSILSDGFVVTLSVSGADQLFTNHTRIVFSEAGTKALDPTDGLKKRPDGLASRWLAVYSLDEDNHSYALQNLPLDIDEKLRIPLDVQTTESGEFTMNWSLPESHIFSGSYFLRDNQTGDVIELEEGSSFRFEITEKDAIQTKEAETENNHPKSLQPSDGSGPRFELLITQSGIDGFTELGAVPESFELGQNYPNPFNPTTVISYQLPVRSQVRLEVYDMIGRQIATLVNEQVAAGRHSVHFDASHLSSGIYLYRLAAGSQVMTKKLTVVK